MAALSTTSSDPYKVAAAKYFLALTSYRRARVALIDVADDVHKFMRDALDAHVRRKFRGIATQLTNRIGFTYSTIAARELLGNFDIDHAVPLCMIHEEILLMSTLEEIESVLRKYVIGVKLTAQEHKDLNKQFKMSMPPMWQWSDDPLARYKAMNLEIV